MKIKIASIVDQFYLLPTVKTTYSRDLNGELELVFVWMRWELIIAI